MRKKLLSLAVSALAMTSILTAPVSADEDPKLPFELSAPEDVSIVWLEGNDSLNTCAVTYSQNDSMSQWASKNADPETHDALVAEYEAMGYEDVWVNTQIDWSIDSENDWHYNPYWDTEGYDEEFHQHLGEWAYFEQAYSADTTNTEWIFRYMGNMKDPEDRRWYGYHEDGGDDYLGWKDVLKEDQYEMEEVDDEANAKIDLTKHTIYVRVRYIATVRKADEEKSSVALKVASDWSKTACVGKEAKQEVFSKEMVAAPKISNLRMTDEEFNGQPVVAVTLEVPAELKTALTTLENRGGGISLDTEARVAGTDEWKGMQGDWVITSGDMKITLLKLLEEGKVIEQDTPIELRCRYYCDMPGDEEDFYSDYSEVLTFGTKEIKEGEKETVEEAEVVDTEEEKAVASDEKEKCSLCGFCPQPLGVCIFIWITVVIVVIVVIAVVVKKRKKK